MNTLQSGPGKVIGFTISDILNVCEIKRWQKGGEDCVGKRAKQSFILNLDQKPDMNSSRSSNLPGGANSRTSG